MSSTTHKLIIEVEGKDKGGSQVLGNVGGGLSKLGGLAAGAVVGVGAAAVGIGSSLAGLATDAAPLEGIQAAFEGIATASGRSMDETLSALERGSLGMVSQRELMMTYNKAAQLVGSTLTNRLPDAMGYLSKVSAATGEDMDFMLNSLVVGVGRLSPMILDNLGIQVALSEATAHAADMFGVEADELTKAQQQAGMMEVVLAKLAENTAAMPDITENASTKMAQMDAQMKNVKDRIGLAVLPVWQQLMGGFASLTEKVGPPLLSFFMDKLIPFFSENVAPVVSEAGKVFGTLASYFGFVLSEGDPLNDFLADLPSWMQPIVEVGGEIVAWLKDALPKAIEIAGDFIEELLIPAYEGIWSFIRDNVLPIFQKISKWLSEDAGKAVTDAVGSFGDLRDKIESAFNTISDVVSRVWAFVKPIILEVGGFILQEFGVVISWVKENWPLIKETISDTINTVYTIITTILTAIQTFWDAHGATISRIITTVWTAIKTIIDTTIKTVLTIIKTVLLLISGRWEEAWAEIYGLLKAAWNLITGAIEEAIPLILSTIATFLTNIVNKVLSIGADLYNAGKAIFEQLKQGLADKFEEVKSWVGDKLQDLRDMLPFSEPKDPTSPLYGLSAAGRAFFDNILEGMKEAAPELVDYVNKALDFAGAFTSFGGTFASKLKEAKIDPLTAQVEALDEQIASLQEELETGYIGRSYSEELRLRQNLVRLTQAQTNASNELARAQSKISEYEQAKERQTFLKQQISLLDKIQQYGLDAQQVLEGITLGGGASLESIITAMTRVTEAINERMSEALGAYVPGLGLNLGTGSAMTTTGNNFYLTAQYGYQDEASLADDVGLLSALYGGV